MKSNIFIMYIGFDHACEFINHKLLLARGTETPKLVGKTLNLNHVTTTNTVHNEKFINKNKFLYKYLLPTIRDKKIQSLQISLILGDGTPRVSKRSICGGKDGGDFRGGGAPEKVIQ
jgi:hypothetical protein